MALDASNGHIVWTHHLDSWGYSTPAVANGRIFVGAFDGKLRSYQGATGKVLWETYVGGRFLGPAMVAGSLVFFAARPEDVRPRTSNGKVVWQIGMGKYSPGIVTERHYFLSLNGILVAFRGRNDPES